MDEANTMSVDIGGPPEPLQSCKELMVTPRSRATRDQMVIEILSRKHARSSVVKFVRLHAMLHKEMNKPGITDLRMLELRVLLLELADWYLAKRNGGEVNEYFIKRYQAGIFIERSVEFTKERCKEALDYVPFITRQSIERLTKIMESKGWFLSLQEQVCVMSNSKYIKLLNCKYQLHLYNVLKKEKLIKA